MSARVSTKLLNPDAVARLKGLELRARTVVSGVLSGQHRSLYKGYSVEFAEHRQYVPGDDIRHVDWRLFGRKDRLYIKQYEEETNLACWFVVDASRSMNYGRGPLNKFAYASCLAASLAYLLAGQQDAFGLLVFDQHVRQRVNPGTGRIQLSNVIKVLEQAEPDETTEVRMLLQQLAGEIRRRSIVVLLSDLLTDPADVIDGIERLSHAGHEVIVMHVLDDDEWRFPFDENVRFDGLEGDGDVLVDAQTLQNAYLAALERFVLKVKTACLAQRADYVPVNTSEPLDVPLTGYLARRMRRRAGRA
jgi:uncharacterized protein (DUF58 family)